VTQNRESTTTGPRKKRKLPKVVSASEANALLRASNDGTDGGLRNELILTLLYRAGLRVSEAINLKPRQIDRDGMIHLYDAKGGDGTAYFDPDSILPLLDRWMVTREAWGGRADGPLFVMPGGRGMNTRYVQRLVKTLKAQLGIQGIVTPHVFRHTFATELIEEGTPLHEVQAALRHANLATTAIYLHVRDESLRRRMIQRTR
jgi:integrase/recombinase XerD